MAAENSKYIKFYNILKYKSVNLNFNIISQIYIFLLHFSKLIPALVSIYFSSINQSIMPPPNFWKVL